MIAALTLFAAAAVQGDDIGVANGVLGRWQTATRHGVVEMSRCGPSICGHLQESDGLRADPQLRDQHNRNPALRLRLLKGMAMLGGFHRNNDVWVGGWIYNGEDGGTYKATIQLADASHLLVKGCMVWPLCKTQTWTRAR